MASTLNLAGLRTPGVYLDEVALFPPSVAQVETAIPAFIGPTEKAIKDGKSVTGIPTKVKSLVEFRQIFGGEPPRNVTVTLDPLNAVESVEMASLHYLFDSLQLFFGNGGEKCYIVSTGDYKTPATIANYTDALDALKKYDQPTLILFPDAVTLTGPGALATVQQAALDLCAKMQNRFAVLDVKKANPAKPDFDENDALAFRESVTNNLKYGAAYYPYLQTSLPLTVSFASLTIQKGTPPAPKPLDELLEVDTKLTGLNADLLAAKNLLPTDAAFAAEGNATKKKFLEDKRDAFTTTVFTDTDIQGDFVTYIAPGPKLTELNTAIGKVVDPPVAVDNDAAIGLLKSYISGFIDKFSARVNARSVTKAITAKNVVADRKALSALPPAPPGLLPKRTDYLAILLQAGRLAFAQKALTDFKGAAAFANADVQADFTAYIDETKPTVNGQKLKDIRSALTAAATMPATNAAFELLLNYIGGFLDKIDSRLQAIEADLRATVPLYATVVTAAEAQGLVLPPSGAVVGAYAATDNARGIWKAPANVGLNFVIGPSVRLNDEEQGGLNIDTNAGKSINAIRSFAGKGTLIWGARTLAGSDREWRYVSVRRFFIMVEESVKRASGQFVFEPNDANTWVKMRAMIENFLTLQWRAGALAGIKAEHAYFVRVGLGQTMTADDILDGRLIIEIGMAVVRPAEFIVLRFSHKMQES